MSTMKFRTHIALFFVGLFLAASLPLSARTNSNKYNTNRYSKPRIVWGSKQNRNSGLYSMRNYFVSHGVTLNVSALYFFGDVDNEGIAFNGGWNMNNFSLGGGVSFAYTLPAGNHCNMRFSLMGGTLHGNNELKFKSLAEPRDDYRKFKSILVQPAVGVEYYPFNRAGFFLYGGIALTASIITEYEFYYYARVNGQKVRTPLRGSTYGLLPMVQLGLGWSWRLTDSWMLSIHAMLQEGLIDTHYMNLDAWPLAPSQNSDGVALGNSFGKWTDRYGDEHIHWNDGWFEFGISISYRWSNCDHCRILNNYYNPRRR